MRRYFDSRIFNSRRKLDHCVDDDELCPHVYLCMTCYFRMTPISFILLLIANYEHGALDTIFSLNLSCRPFSRHPFSHSALPAG
jgi:hypothetical protein